jgi:hypothetical protein
MAQKPNPRKLSFVEIVMGADAEVIRAAHEARVKIDALLAEREAAYRKILELEGQVETVIGEEGVFVYPPPPAPVAGIPKLEPAARKGAESATAKPASAKKASAAAAVTEDGDEDKEKNEEGKAEA